MSDFSKHTVSDYYKCCQGELVLEFTNEIHDDTIEDDVRNIRGDIVREKVFGFYRTVRDDSDAVGNFELVKNVKKSFFLFYRQKLI